MDESLRDRFGERLGEIARSWRICMGRRLQPHGLSHAQWVALRTLADKGDGTVQKELADAIGVEGSTMVGTLDRLERANLIERREAAHDRRYKRVHLSGGARDRLSELHAVHRALRHDLLEGISDEDLAVCLKVFERILGRAQEVQ